jgi:glycosyltransferase involved in cell wall biosynthesis
VTAGARVSIVIPTVNRDALLCDTLQAVLTQDHPCAEVIVVDQSDRHDLETVRFLDSVAGRIRYHHQSPPNLPAARNTGVRLATGEIILFFDDDLQMPPGVVAAVAADFANPEVAGVTGLIASLWDAGHEKYESFRRYVDDPAVLRRPGLLPVDHFFGGFMAFRRRVFQTVGGFDEWIGTQPTAAAEDLEFCMRVRRAGFRLCLDTSLTVVNVGGSRAAGGCEKGTLARDVVLNSQMMLLLYAHLKNERGSGPLRWWRSLTPAYRGYVLNRGILRGGAHLVWERHVRFARALRAASRAVVEGRRRPAERWAS